MGGLSPSFPSFLLLLSRVHLTPHPWVKPRDGGSLETSFLPNSEPWRSLERYFCNCFFLSFNISLNLNKRAIIITVIFPEPLTTNNKHCRYLAANWGKWGSTESHKTLDSVSDLGKGQTFCPASVSSQVTYCYRMSKKNVNAVRNTLTKSTFLYLYNLLYSTLPTWMPQYWVDTSLSPSL